MKKKSKQNELRRSMKQLLTAIVLVLMVGLLGATVNAQNVTVTGSVKNTAGEPVPGTTVVVKGTTQGTVTNADGEYSITNIPEDATLVFSFVGMRTQEVEVGTQTTIDVTMEVDAIGIEEVVAVGYGTMKKSDLTGSVSSVSADELELVPLNSSTQILQGRLAGVEVVEGSFAPGSPSTVTIRGGNSMLGSNDPLYIIDGFPGDFFSLNPQDIESVEVLKDASATAIYGSRGANGVVIVTTKKGKEGKTTIDVNVYHGIKNLRKKLDLLNAKEYATLANEKARNIGRADYYELNNLPGETDWQDVIYQTAQINNYNLSIRGGNQINKFAISSNYLDEEGILKSTGFKRATIRVNLDNKINSWMKVETFATGLHSESKNAMGGFSWNNVITSALQTPPVAPVFDENGDYYILGNLPSADPVWHNPLVKIDGYHNKTSENQFSVNSNFIFSLFDGLDFSVRLAANYENRRNDGYTERIIPGSGNGSGGISENDSYTLLNENIITYIKEIGKHSLNVTSGVTAEENNYYSVGASARDFVTDRLLTDNLGSGAVINGVSSYRSKYTMLSGIGRLNYKYGDKYLITFTARADGSSRLGAENKWGFFPSSAIAWRVSEENFLKGNSIISNLKLRASWGQTGNQEIGLYNSLARLSNTVITMGENETRRIGFVPSAMENPNLKWEVTEQVDFGFDVGLFNQKLDLTFDYYVKNTSDLLALVPLPMSSGYSSILKNFGDMKNKGFEFSLFYDIINNKKFSWNMRANLSQNRNEVLKVATSAGEFFANSLEDPVATSVNIIKEGFPLSSFYGFISDGLWDSDQGTESIQPNAKAGDQKYKDINDDGTINDLDKTILGDPYPDFIYGLNSFISYKDFEFQLFIQGSQGGTVFNGLNFTLADNFARNSNQFADVIGNHWSTDNPDTNAKYPRLSATGPKVSDKQFEDVSYLRVKDITLAYNLPFKKLKFDWFTKARIYISAQNLFTFTSFSGYDPEIRNSYHFGGLVKGVDYGTYPSAKTFTLGLNLSF
ncbi:MAG: SusC/RagA family TonB-linked outer membrane protein [Bacteroidota bacterium]